MNRLIDRLLAPFAVRCGGALHYSHTAADALAWAACYPAAHGPVLIVSRRTGRVVATRTAVEC